MKKAILISICLILIIFIIVLCLILANTKKEEERIQDTKNLNEDKSQEKDTNNIEAEKIKKEDEEIDNGDEDMKKINLNINGQNFTATLYDNLAVEELLEKLPLTITMSELNGNEKYYYFSDSFTTNTQNIGNINEGDIMLYGNNCLVIFYDSFSTSYSYTKIGHIDNPENLKSVFGNSSVDITIEK